MIYTIPIHGLIGLEEEGQKTFSYSDFLLHFNNAKDADIINLDIASLGGYCEDADKMIDLLISSGKIITSSNSGDVASAASKIFMVGKIRKYDATKGQFLIHNPWGEIAGDSDELSIYSKELKTIENNYANFYVDRTGANLDVLRAFMKENVPLTPEQVQDLGFATLVQPQEFKAVAKININLNNEQMNEAEIKSGFERIEKLFEGFKAMFKPKAIMIADVDGNELDFPELNDPAEIAVGVKVELQGSAANGDFTQPDGTVYKVEAGVLTEIIPAVVEDETEALKAEVEALKTQLAEANTKAVEASAVIEEKEKAIEAQAKAVEKINTEFKEFKAQASSFVPDAATPEGDEPTKTKLTFKIKK